MARPVGAGEGASTRVAAGRRGLTAQMHCGTGETSRREQGRTKGWAEVVQVWDKCCLSVVFTGDRALNIPPAAEHECWRRFH